MVVDASQAVAIERDGGFGVGFGAEDAFVKDDENDEQDEWTENPVGGKQAIENEERDDDASDDQCELNVSGANMAAVELNGGILMEFKAARVFSARIE